MKKLILAAAMAAMSVPAMADTILAFGQSGLLQTINGTATTSDCSIAIGPTCGSNIDGTNIPIVITAIGSANPTPLVAFLALDVTASSPLLTAGPALFQEFAGSFSITSGLNGTGTNYLSAVFVDLVAGLDGGSGLTMSASNPPDPLAFTSDVIDMTNYTTPFALSFSFTDVTPVLAACGGVIKTLCAFDSNVSGNMSAFAAVPEPGSMALIGIGLVGLAGVGRRKFNWA